VEEEDEEKKKMNTYSHAAPIPTVGLSCTLNEFLVLKLTKVWVEFLDYIVVNKRRS
jgi:hypothetical protein